MAIAFTAIELRGSRRVRLAFTNTLAAGAFVAALYSVVSADGAGPDPGVVAAFVVAGSANVVELALGDDLVDGGLYTVTAGGVPATDGSSTPNGSALQCRPGERKRPPIASALDDDPLAELFGVDLVWDGDLALDATGDLATVTGPQNAEAAVLRRQLSNGLPWDPEYGAHPRKYVDGSRLMLPQLRGAMVEQAVADDRVARATATVLPPDEAHPEEGWIETTIVLVDDSATKLTAPVKTQ